MSLIAAIKRACARWPFRQARPPGPAHGSVASVREPPTLVTIWSDGGNELEAVLGPFPNSTAAGEYLYAEVKAAKQRGYRVVEHVHIPEMFLIEDQLAIRVWDAESPLPGVLLRIMRERGITNSQPPSTSAHT